MDNPFNATFGELPLSHVSREKDIATIKTAFSETIQNLRFMLFLALEAAGKPSYLRF